MEGGILIKNEKRFRDFAFAFRGRPWTLDIRGLYVYII